MRARSAACLAATLVIAVLVLASMLSNTGGRVVLPLDDAYIYLQYASQNADGEFFRYNDGDPATTGATSLLYVLLLTPFALVFSGNALAAIAFVLGAVFFFLTLRSASSMAAEWIDPRAATPAWILVALSGPFVWGAFSGMEIAVVAFLACQAVRAVARLGEVPSSSRSFVVWTSLFAVSRPEAAVVVALLILLLIGLRRTALRTLAIPLAAASVPFLMNLALTGHPGSTALASKAAPFFPDTSPTTWVLSTTEFFIRNLKGLFASGDTAFGGWPNAYTSLVTFAAPLTLLFAVIGVFPGLMAEFDRRTPRFAATSLVFVGGSLAIWAALVPINLHWSRYAIPYLPLIAVWVLAGVWRVARRLDDEGETTVRRGLVTFFTGMSAVIALFFVAAFGWNAREIHDQHIALAEWTEENLPPSAPLATNDVGALRYFGSRPVLDLHGLTSQGFAAAKQVGTGAVYEALERLPMAERPRYFAVIPHWFEPEFLQIMQPLRIQTLNQPSISGSPLALYRADWTGIGSADLPGQATLSALRGRRLVDRLDVADLESEDEHAYEVSLRPASHASPLGIFRDPDSGRPLVDGVRRVTGGERFSMTATAGRPSVLVIRALGSFRAELQLPDGTSRPIRSEGAADRWTEIPVTLPPAPAAGAEIHLRALDGGIEEGGYLSAHYWLYQ